MNKQNSSRGIATRQACEASDTMNFYPFFHPLKGHFIMTEIEAIEKIITSEHASGGMRAFFAGSMDLPPGVNASYQPGSGRHPIVATEELHQFKDKAALLLSQGYHDYSLINAIRQSKRKVPLKVDLHFFFRTMWKQDIDGGIKAVLDATFARIDLNDNLVVDLHVSKRVDPDRPRAEVEVYCALSSH